MPLDLAPPTKTSLTAAEIFKQNANVIVIDDTGGPADPGTLVHLMSANWAKTSRFFHVNDIQGETPEKQIEDFRIKLAAVAGENTDKIIFILDRDLRIGRLPLPQSVPDKIRNSSLGLDGKNHGPALVPYLRKWFNNAPIVGFTGEGDVSGIREIYSGAAVVQKPDYALLKETLVAEFVKHYAAHQDLRFATLPTASA